MNAQRSNPADYSASAPVRFVASAEYAGLRLDQTLARLLPEHSRSRLQGWLRAGRIRVEGVAVVDAKRKIWGGEQIEVEAVPNADSLEDAAEDIALAIVHEDADILVIDKPAGLVVHPGSGNRAGTLLNALLHHSPALAAIPRAGIVHRLDKDTSGLLVVAKTLEAQTDLVRQLQARTVRRHYLALVHGRVARGGTVDVPIGRHPTQRIKMAVVGNGREARTHYEVLERFDQVSLLECRLETGRTHQIRVHMASIGHPLVGDPTYGRRGVTRGVARSDAGSPLAAFSRQALHAHRLALVHPGSRTELAWASPLPADFADLLAWLRRA